MSIGMSGSKHIERFQLRELKHKEQEQQHKEQQHQRKENKEQEQPQQLKEQEKEEDEKWLPKSRQVRMPERVYDEYGAWQDVAAALEPQDDPAFDEEWRPYPRPQPPRAREPLPLWSTGRQTNRERWIADRMNSVTAAATDITAGNATTEITATAIKAARSDTLPLRYGYRGWTAPYATIDHHAPPPPPTPINLTPPTSPMPRSAAAVMAAAATLWTAAAVAAAAASTAEPLKEQQEHESDDNEGSVHEKSASNWCHAMFVPTNCFTRIPL